MITRRHLPPLAVALAWALPGLVVLRFPSWMGSGDDHGWLAAALLAAGAATVAALLSGRVDRRWRDRLAAWVFPALGPAAFLVCAAGGVRSPAVAILALLALGAAARRGAGAGAATGLGALLLAAAIDLRLERGIVASDLVAASALVLAAGVVPAWFFARLEREGSEARRRLERVEGYVARRRRTPERAGSAVAESPERVAAAAQTERLVRLRSLEEHLRDLRDRIGADEVVLWRQRDDGDPLVFEASSTEGAAEPLYFDEERWGPLLRWSVEAEIVHADGEEDAPRCVVAPVTRDGRRYGALSITARAGLTLSHQGALDWAGRWARHVALLAQLFEIRADRGQVHRRERAVAAVAEALHRGATTEEAARQVCRTAVEISGASGAALVAWDAGAASGVVRAASDGHHVAVGTPVVADSLVGGRCVERLPLHMADARAFHDSGAPVYAPGEARHPLGALSVLPLEQEGTVVGAIVVHADRPDGIARAAKPTLDILASLAAGSLRLHERREHAERAARSDALTGLSNRRHFEEEMARVFADAIRHGDETSLLIADVDHFKRVNDSYGHEAGDAVLRHVARLFRERVRPNDLAARFGGEEIVILCPRTGLDGARQLAERLRESLERAPLPWEGMEIAVTASFGVASHPASVRESDALLGAADAALYAAKREGRNRVRSAPARADAATA